MKVTITEQDGRMVAALSGDLDNSVCDEVRKAIEPLIQQNDKDVVIDCEELNYISSSGLRILLSVYNHQRTTGHRSILACMQGHVKEVLKTVGFLSFFDTEQ